MLFLFTVSSHVMRKQIITPDEFLCFFWWKHQNIITNTFLLCSFFQDVEKVEETKIYEKSKPNHRDRRETGERLRNLANNLGHPFYLSPPITEHYMSQVNSWKLE